jgi:hypothetical protein
MDENVSLWVGLVDADIPAQDVPGSAHSWIAHLDDVVGNMAFAAGADAELLQFFENERAQTVACRNDKVSGACDSFVTMCV